MADLLFVWDANILVRTLDKMNNSRPIIEIFLFPHTERTERIFSSNFANVFYFCPHTKMLHTPKIVSINRSRDITREQTEGLKNK